MNVILWTIIVSLLGVAVGSFLNVVVFRVKENEPLTGRSKCRTCLEPVKGIDLIPIISFFSLKGRCRQCSSVIEWQYPIIELTTGVMFGLLFIRAVTGIAIPDFVTGDELTLLFIRDAIIGCFLLIIFVYDFKYSYILDKFSVPAILLALMINASLGASLQDMLLGGFLIGAFFAFQFLVSRGKWIGGGDIRMGLLMGFYLGLELGVVALFLSYVMGAFIGVLLIVFKHRKPDSHVPFGTFMALSMFATLFFGQSLLDWYLGFFL
jgi:prepilin signal peptidase PulO-like enzyme (type II secretory pathway)